MLRGGRLAPVLAVAVVVQALPLAAPLLLSKDVYLYWDEARIVTVHHASPYRATPADYPSDPAFNDVSEEWRTSAAPYGPVWETLSLAPAAAAGSSARDAVAGYKLLALLGVLVTLALVAVGTRSTRAVAALGWNPLVALHFAGGGHSDSWLVVFLCLAVVARRRAPAGGAWSLAGGFKPVPLALLPIELAAARLRPGRRFWTALVAVAVVVGIVPTAIWGPGWIRGSLIGIHGSSPLGGVHWLMQAGLSHRDAVVLAGLVFVAVFCVLVVHAWRHGRARLGLAAAALCLTTSLLRPWYGIWPAALAAVEDDGLAMLAAAALSAYLLLGDAVQL